MDGIKPKKLRVVYILLLAASLSSCDFMYHTRCRDKTLNQKQSPDGRFEAVIHSRHCANETGLYTWVGLKEASIMQWQSETTTVLTVRGIQNIDAVWKSSTHLEIELPKNLTEKDVLTQKESWQAVTISYDRLYDGLREPY